MYHLYSYIVPYLRDLTLIDEGNPDFIENGLINFAKRSKISEVCLHENIAAYFNNS